MIYADFYRQYQELQTKYELCGRLMNSHTDFFNQETREMFRKEQESLRERMNNLEAELKKNDIVIGRKV